MASNVRSVRARRPVAAITVHDDFAPRISAHTSVREPVATVRQLSDASLNAVCATVTPMVVAMVAGAKCARRVSTNTTIVATANDRL